MNNEVTIGMKVMRVPELAFDAYDGYKWVEGTVVYIHPKKRYHTVSFGPGKIKQSFFGVAVEQTIGVPKGMRNKESEIVEKKVRAGRRRRYYGKFLLPRGTKEIDVNLAPCECGGEPKAFDLTDAIFGFDGFVILCEKCGKKVKSAPIHSVRIDENGARTPMMSRNEVKEVCIKMIHEWNARYEEGIR